LGVFFWLGNDGKRSGLRIFSVTTQRFPASLKSDPACLSAVDEKLKNNAQKSTRYKLLYSSSKIFSLTGQTVDAVST
jgi:hypothetical protein